MREISRFQRSVAVALQELKNRSESDSFEEEEEYICGKFRSSRQEPIRMAMALWGYFRIPPVKESARKEFAAYLKLRVRNAAEALIEEDEPDKIELFESMGWFGRTELDEFIRTARERQKTQSLISLMTLKNQKYGYREQKFEFEYERNRP